ncbi:right-handed parallel beta-helix repeat-containing protein [Luteolibacter sp. Y139]|uniref:Right-handed parallel beta-helix repeat-containing protein n=1 Tax=Luteolibacter soli TaxID=3135280 RepID=A0ABU9ATD7_9BACT
MCLVAPAVQAATYHVDPATGNMSNPGTASQPWSTLEAVFTANKTFAAGDEILLYSGYHGAPIVKGNNSDFVKIRPAAGATPKLKNLIVRSGSRWDISGLDICPEHQAAGTTYTSAPLVEIESSANYITMHDCLTRGALSTSGWSIDNWKNLAGRGIRTAATNTLLENNRIEVSSHALTVRRTASFTTVRKNTIKGFSCDGMQALADDCLYEGNTITDGYIFDNAHNHDDFFQSWSVGSDGFTSGEGTIARVTVRGNLFISRTDRNQPYPTEPQGIGLFDGYYQDWVIENNVIATNAGHGIAIYGAIDCKVVNNTVIENPFNAPSSTRPWIKIAAHKTRTTPSTGNLVRNNITAKPVDPVADSSTVDYNQTTTSYTSYFADFSNFDFKLKSTSPAKDAGTTASAPLTDIAGTVRSAPYDLGAYEFGASSGAAGTTYASWLQANGLPVDGSGLGAKTANPSKDGVTNEMKFALGLPTTVQGHGGRVTTGTSIVSNQRYLTLTFICPDPAPEGVSYEVESAANLSAWSATSVTEMSNTVTGGLRTRIFRDTAPIGRDAKRFIRLEATAP